MISNTKLSRSQVCVHTKDGSFAIDDYMMYLDTITHEDTVDGDNTGEQMDEESNIDSNDDDDTTGTAVKNIHEPLLAYIVFALQSGTTDNVRRAVLGCFSSTKMYDAKEALWSNYNNSEIQA